MVRKSWLFMSIVAMVSGCAETDTYETEGRHTPDVALGISDACCYTVEALDKDEDAECPLS